MSTPPHLVILKGGSSLAERGVTAAVQPGSAPGRGRFVLADLASDERATLAKHGELFGNLDFGASRRFRTRTIAEPSGALMDRGGHVARTHGVLDLHARHSGEGVDIAILSGGIDPHADFRDQIAVVHDAISGSDLSVGTRASGVGTLVAGLAGARGTVTGMAPGASILDIRVLGGEEERGTTASILAGLDRVAALAHERGRPMVVVLPFSGPTVWVDDDAVHARLRTLRDAGVFIVASAGDRGPDEGTVTSPGNSDAVFTTGALDTKGTDAIGDDEVVRSSGMGGDGYDAGHGQYNKPDAVAAGRFVMTTGPDDTYVECSGSHVAAGTAAGIAAVILGAARSYEQAGRLRVGLETLVASGHVDRILRQSANGMPEASFAAGAGALDARAAMAQLETEYVAPDLANGAGFGLRLHELRATEDPREMAKKDGRRIRLTPGQRQRLSRPIEYLADVVPETKREILRQRGITHIGYLVQCTSADLLGAGFRAALIERIREQLGHMMLSLAMTLHDWQPEGPRDSVPHRLISEDDVAHFVHGVVGPEGVAPEERLFGMEQKIVATGAALGEKLSLAGVMSLEDFRPVLAAVFTIDSFAEEGRTEASSPGPSELVRRLDTLAQALREIGAWDFRIVLDAETMVSAEGLKARQVDAIAQRLSVPGSGARIPLVMNMPTR